MCQEGSTALYRPRDLRGPTTRCLVTIVTCGMTCRRDYRRGVAADDKSGTSRIPVQKQQAGCPLPHSPHRIPFYLCHECFGPVCAAHRTSHRRTMDRRAKPREGRLVTAVSRCLLPRATFSLHVVSDNHQKSAVARILEQTSTARTLMHTLELNRSCLAGRFCISLVVLQASRGQKGGADSTAVGSCTSLCLRCLLLDKNNETGLV